VTGVEDDAELPYGRTRFVDVASGRSTRIGSRAACRAWLETREPRS